MNHRDLMKFSDSMINLNYLTGEYGEMYVCYEFLKRNYEIYRNPLSCQIKITF